jgi:hypothetical protein
MMVHASRLQVASLLAVVCAACGGPGASHQDGGGSGGSAGFGGSGGSGGSSGSGGSGGATAASVLTYHNDNARTGQNTNEIVLAPSNVNAGKFGKTFSQPVDSYLYARSTGFIAPVAMPVLRSSPVPHAASRPPEGGQEGGGGS